MILSDQSILAAIEAGDIVITPFERVCLGSNSYDVHLGNKLLMYDREQGSYLDPKRDNPTVPVSKHFFADKWLLVPGRLYLASTLEYTECHRHVPFLEGKSSLGRLGVSIHATAGKGDVGFCNHWTMEISVVEPVILYPGMAIAQLIFFEVAGEVQVPYNKKESAKYNNKNPWPEASKYFRNYEQNDTRAGQ